MTYDWLKASVDARRALYRVCKRVVDGQFVGHWQHFYEAALGSAAIAGTGYEDNFRSGRIGRTKAAALARWLSAHHPDLFHELDYAVCADAPRGAPAWDEFLRTHGRDSALEIVRIDGLNLVGFARSQSQRVATMRRGEEFCFRLTSSHRGHCIAMQRAGDVWFPLPLSDQVAVPAIAAGTQFLPRTMGDEIIPLSEESDTGAFEFVILIGPEVCARSMRALMIEGAPIAPDNLAEIARTFAEAAPVEVHRARLIII